MGMDSLSLYMESIKSFGISQDVLLTSRKLQIVFKEIHKWLAKYEQIRIRIPNVPEKSPLHLKETGVEYVETNRKEKDYSV